MIEDCTIFVLFTSQNLSISLTFAHFICNHDHKYQKVSQCKSIFELFVMGGKKTSSYIIIEKWLTKNTQHDVHKVYNATHKLLLV